jgi:extracellular elastinolytic metalloproteinase
MTHHRCSGPCRAGATLATLVSLALAGFAAGTSYAVAGHAGDVVEHGSSRAALGGPGVTVARAGYVDVTGEDTPAPRVRHAAGIGTGIVTDISGVTGTVRFRGDLDGYLTRRSSRSAQHIALEYVRRHHAELGLAVRDLRTFHLARRYTDIVGTRHLYFAQRVHGTAVDRNGLTASVTRSGHLLTVGGMPVSLSSASRVLPPAPALTITTAAQALAATRGAAAPGGDLGVDTGRDTGDDTARRVLLATTGGLRPAWETVVTSSATPATTVVDAVTGDVLLRTPLTQYEHSTGRVYQFFPGARRGGRQTKVDFTRRHWLGRHARTLRGNNAHAFSDVNDDNRPERSEEVHPRRGQSWGYRLRPFHLGSARSFCGRPWPCSWNPNRPYSWRVNRAQNATQVFFFVNSWHDHLERAPVGFTEAAGNFQLRNHSHQGRAGDPVITQTDDGASTGLRFERLKGLPDAGHIDNANMSTPPDGHRPTMQMYLQHEPHTAYPGGDPFSPTNVGDEADTVYHEYTHGLSNRLNVDVRGRSTLGGVQAGAMGEGWSDWYAMDYLVRRHLQRDRPRRADVRLFVYDGKGVRYDRTEPIDCKVGKRARLCRGGDTDHGGGYTYADYGRVVGFPEVHGDGEIWAQTLWGLRDRLGSGRSESLVTRAMELAPYNPSFLDMRNAILVADNAVFHGRHHRAIWRVFARRGMGFNAGSFGGNDGGPAAGFAMPPSTSRTGAIQGTVTDQVSGKPVRGMRVSLAFQGSGAVNPTAVTDDQGHYTIVGVPPGHFGELQATGHGYRTARTVTVHAGETTTADFTLG